MGSTNWRHVRSSPPDSRWTDQGGATPEITRRRLLAAAGTLGVLASRAGSAANNPNGRLVWGTHISLAPTWFDPAEVGGVITPFMMLYAIHDGLVKPMPNNPEELCLAESYTPSADGLSHEFVLRSGTTFHNGERITAEDVKFSYQRYRGNAARFLKAKVAAVETPDPRRVVFRLNAPWPDFLTYYSGVTGAGWVVPKRYVESVGEDGFKKAPIGAGPYKFVSFNPGVELVLEAFEDFWRKTSTVKKLVFRVIPDETTRLAALKRGEVDIAYSIRGELAEEVQRTPGLELKPVVLNGAQWIYFPDQWDLKSPWHDCAGTPSGKRGIESRCDQSGPDARSFPDHGQHCAEELQVFLATAENPVRSTLCARITGRGRIPWRLRRRGLLLRRILLQFG